MKSLIDSIREERERAYYERPVEAELARVRRPRLAGEIAEVRATAADIEAVRRMFGRRRGRRVQGVQNAANRRRD